MYLDEHVYFGLLGLAATALVLAAARIRYFHARIQAIQDAEIKADRLVKDAQREASSLVRNIQVEIDNRRAETNQVLQELRATTHVTCRDMCKEAEVEAEQMRAAARQDLDALLLAAEFEAANRKQMAETSVSNLHADLQALREDYRAKKQRYDELVRTVAAFDDEVELAELGFYKPHFDFDTSESFKEAIREVKSLQKEMVSDKLAIVCHTTWYVDDNRRKGETLTNRAIRLTARAFNNECDSAVAKVRWNNITRLELRIRKAFESINRANASNNIEIASEYLDLKLKELRLTHEYREKRHEEREHKAELRRQEREEEKLRKDAADAAREAAKIGKLLEKAHREAINATEARMQSLRREIEQLTEDLAGARSRNERALSMAEQTRSGYVYVVSNVGAFGRQVHKIGMTRRLDPMDRVRELSAASVPFAYDTHAMVYSENAPQMEAALHQTFADRRVNKVNNRKEFFHVSLEEVKNEVLRLFPDADFIEGVEARDFRETKSLEDRLASAQSKNDALHRFSETLD